jgi:hypothetical protein
MNNQQRNHALFECIRDRLERAKNVLAFFRWLFLNNILFYKDKACSFFTIPYK